MQRAVFPSSGRVFAFQDGGFCRYPSTGRRRQTGRPNARPRTGCITRRTYFLRIIFKVLRLVYYCASVGADFYSFSYRTSCDLVARDQNLSPLAQPGFWRWLPAGRNRLCLHSCSIVCLVNAPLLINRWPSGNGSSSRRQVSITFCLTESPEVAVHQTRAEIELQPSPQPVNWSASSTIKSDP